MNHDEKPEPPKPREWWLIQDHNREIRGAFGFALDPEKYQRGWKIIHVREVIEEAQ